MTTPFARTLYFFGWVVCGNLFALPASADILYVWTNSPSPGPPYANWATAAHRLQDAVDAAQPGDTVLANDGVYNSGGRALSDLIANRVAIDKAITVQSVNGPQVTVIDGADAGRCAYVGNGAVLNGFTLTRGVADSGGDGEGGGAWCAAGAVVTNCVFTGNWAYYGGGTSGGLLYNCTLIDNWAYLSGGGTVSSTLFSWVAAQLRPRLTIARLPGIMPVAVAVRRIALCPTALLPAIMVIALAAGHREARSTTAP